ncbi:MAG: type II toxin-antitoxin system VapC family toxin [Dehalococcoidia bacterium]|nr:type II toxin-antitoxin system VapC family toxin [Dehalococcoidia bacterium]
MAYLLDTNIIAELRKGQRGNRGVLDWIEGVEATDLFLSVLVLGEIRLGIERLRPRDPRQADALETWHDDIDRRFAGRVLDVTTEVADRWGRIRAARPLPIIDSLLAATALVHGLTFVTRNGRDVAGLGVDVLDPFEG